MRGDHVTWQPFHSISKFQLSRSTRPIQNVGYWIDASDLGWFSLHFDVMSVLCPFEKRGSSDRVAFSFNAIILAFQVNPNQNVVFKTRLIFFKCTNMYQIWDGFVCISACKGKVNERGSSDRVVFFIQYQGVSLVGQL